MGLGRPRASSEAYNVFGKRSVTSADCPIPGVLDPHSYLALTKNINAMRALMLNYDRSSLPHHMTIIRSGPKPANYWSPPRHDPRVRHPRLSTQMCRFPSQKVREKSRLFVAPPRAFPLPVCVTLRGKFKTIAHKFTHLSMPIYHVTTCASRRQKVGCDGDSGDETRPKVVLLHYRRNRCAIIPNYCTCIGQKQALPYARYTVIREDRGYYR